MLQPGDRVIIKGELARTLSYEKHVGKVVTAIEPLNHSGSVYGVVAENGEKFAVHAIDCIVLANTNDDFRKKLALV